MKYIVYKTTCLINNKIYIGVHKTEDPEIFDGYLGRGFYINRNHYINNPISPLHFAIKKYGVKNFERSTLIIYDNEEDAYNYEAKLVNEEFIKSDKTYNVCLGGKGRPRPSDPVFQFNLKGELIRSYESVLEASKIVEVSESNIREAIKFKRTSSNSLWNNIPIINDITEYNVYILSKYYLYDSEGYFVKEFSSNKDIIDYLETNSSNVKRAVDNNYKINGYFISNEKFEKLQITVNKLSGKLNRYDLNGNYLDSYSTIKEAKEKLGLKLSSISSAIRLNKQCNGYFWTRNNNPPSTIEVPDVTIFNNNKKVKMMDTKGNIIKIFNSLSDAKKEYPGCQSVIRGITKTCKGYIFQYFN